MRTKTATTSETAASARELLDKNLRTIDRELEKIEKISKMDAQIPLVPEYAMALVQYAKTLVAVDKNKKEHPDDDSEGDELKHLSDAELTELARKVIFEKNEKKKK